MELAGRCLQDVEPAPSEELRGTHVVGIQREAVGQHGGGLSGAQLRFDHRTGSSNHRRGEAGPVTEQVARAAGAVGERYEPAAGREYQVRNIPDGKITTR